MWDLLETEKSHKKSHTTAKLQENSSKTENCAEHIIVSKAPFFSVNQLRVSTLAENRIRNPSVSKGFDQLERASANHTH